MLSTLRSRLPDHGTVAGYLALFVALGGTSYAVATGSIDSREIKNDSVRSTDVRNNSIRSKDVRNRSLRARDFGSGQLPAGPQGPKGEPGVVGTPTVQRADVAVPDNSTADGVAQCPSGTRIIGGSVNIQESNSEDVNITISRPYLSTAAATLPNSGDSFDGWRGVVRNPAGGTGATTMRVWAICAPPAP